MRARFGFALQHVTGIRVGGLIGVSAAFGVSLAAGACSSSNETTHGFVAVDSSTMLPSSDGGDDSSIGMVVTTGDASNGSDGDDTTTTSDDDGGGDDTTGDSATGADDGSTTSDASTGAHVCDGVIGPTEYGNETNLYNSYANAGGTGQTWYMDWDDVNLYVGLATANVNEPLVLYLGENNATSSGNSFGFSSYDGTDPSSLPFPANFVVFAKGYAPGSPAYSEFRLANGTSWSASSQLTPAVNVCVVAGDAGGVTTREVVIPWSIMGGSAGRPSGFKFLGYVETGNASSPFIYGQMPTGNPGGTSVTAADTQYFSVINSAKDAGLPAFADTL